MTMCSQMLWKSPTTCRSNRLSFDLKTLQKDPAVSSRVFFFVIYWLTFQDLGSYCSSCQTISEISYEFVIPVSQYKVAVFHD